nr:ATP-dependent DNA helicase PIF1-like [Tanacetum cinerariifolium]
VIGFVVAIGDVVPVQSAAGRKIRRTVVIDDSEKVKYWDGTPSIHNALFGTKMFINCDLPEIQAFCQRFKELPEYDENQFKISVFTPQKPELMERHGMDVDEYWPGELLDLVGLFLRRPVFSHGQLYVAVSRVKSKKGLKVLCSNKDGNYSNSTSNVVYKEVLVRI